jgi:hypothetical protein
VLGLKAVSWYHNAAAWDYVTAFHPLALLVGIFLISAWYLGWGASTLRRRLLVVGLTWLALLGWFVAFRPAFNGDLAI